MFVPHYFAVEDEPEIRRLVACAGSAQLVTVGSGGYPLATLLPIIWEGDTVIAHMARANPHWQEIHGGAPALLIVTGPQAYISPPGTPPKQNTVGSSHVELLRRAPGWPSASP